MTCPGKRARTLYPISLHRLKTNSDDVYSLSRTDLMVAVPTSIRHSGIETFDPTTSGRAFQEAFELCRKQHHLYLELRAFCRTDATTTEFSGLHAPIQHFTSLTVHRPRCTPWPAAAGRRRVLCPIVALSLFKDRLCSACLILVTTNSGKTALAASLSCPLHANRKASDEGASICPKTTQSANCIRDFAAFSTSSVTPNPLSASSRTWQTLAHTS